MVAHRPDFAALPRRGLRRADAGQRLGASLLQVRSGSRGRRRGGAERDPAELVGGRRSPGRRSG